MRAPYKFTVGDNSTGQCSACMEVFFGEGAFDRHRRGEEPDRRCIDPATEPVVPGKKFWWLDSRERWHFSRPMTEADRARISGRDGANRGQSAEPGLTGPPATTAAASTGTAA